VSEPLALVVEQEDRSQHPVGTRLDGVHEQVQHLAQRRPGGDALEHHAL
jgi:hypothetical protein